VTRSLAEEIENNQRKGIILSVGIERTFSGLQTLF
jgi:hypothetical protein